MKAISPLKFIKVMKGVQPLLEAIGKANLPVSTYTTPEPKEIEDSGKKFWVVICTSKFDTKEKAEQFIKVDQELDSITDKLA